MNDPSFKSAFESSNPGLLQSMLDAAASQSTGTVDGMSTAALADALLSFSKDELLNMLKKTLEKDKPDVILSKIFNRAVKSVDGLIPVYLSKIMEGMANSYFIQLDAMSSLSSYKTKLAFMQTKVMTSTHTHSKTPE